MQGAVRVWLQGNDRREHYATMEGQQSWTGPSDGAESLRPETLVPPRSWVVVLKDEKRKVG